MKNRLISILLILSMLFSYASPVFALSETQNLELDGCVGETSSEIVFQVNKNASGLKAEVSNIKKDRLLNVLVDVKPVIQLEGTFFICYLQFTGKHAGTCELDYSISYTLSGKKCSETRHIIVSVVNERVEKAKDKAAELASSASSTASDAWDATKNKASEIKENVTDKASDLYGKAGDVISVAKSKTSETLSALKNKFISWYGTAKDAAVYVYDEAAKMTIAGYNKANQKAKELIGDASDYISSLKNDTPEIIEYAEFDPDHPIRDSIPGVEFDETDSHYLGTTDTVEKFIAYYISSVLSARGYEVYNGAVYYRDKVYGGLIYTKNEPFLVEEGKAICSCGFMQLIPSDYSGLRITDDVVQSGLIAVSTPVQGTEAQPFIVEEYTLIDDFSGIFDNHYFRYTQTGPYVTEIKILENKASNYDATIELYNFDNEKYVYFASDAQTEVEVLYNDNSEAFEGSVSTVNAIVDLEENSTDFDETATVIVLDGNSLDQVLNLARSGSGKVIGFAKNAIRNVRLSSGQFLGINADGSSSVYGIASNMNAERTTDGIISTVGSGLGVAGSVASIVCVSAGGILIVKAIVITVGTMAIVYNISNLIEGIENVYYGAQGNSAEATNPVLIAFKKAIPDEATAELVYHCWGIGTTILTNMLVPVNSALHLAKCKGLNTFKTCVSVARAALTYSAKLFAAGVGAGLVSKYVSKVVSKATKDECMGKLVGFGSALVTGMLVYQGLDAIDKNLNISGLYPKNEIVKAFKSANDKQHKNYASSERISRRQRGENEELINWLVDAATEEFQLDARPNVKVYYDPKCVDLGAYDYSNNTIYVNMSHAGHQGSNGVVELFNTIGHECEHAFQWQVVHNPQDYPDIPPELINQWRIDFNSYISPDPSFANFDAYTQQSIELDADTAGSWFADHMLSALGFSV